MDLELQAARTLSPFFRGSNQAVYDQTEPEVDDCAHVEPEGTVTSHRWERREQGEIHYVAQYNRQQRLEKIREHCWFRHREPGLRFRAPKV